MRASKIWCVVGLSLAFGAAESRAVTVDPAESGLYEPYRVATGVTTRGAPTQRNAIDFIPGSGKCGGNSTQSVGWQFDVLNDTTVTAMAWFDDDGTGLALPHEVGIFDPVGNLIATTHLIIPAGAVAALDGIWRVVDITPTTLPTGNGYIVGGYNGVHRKCLSGDVVQTVHPDLDFFDATYSLFGPSFERPTRRSSATNGFYGVGFQLGQATAEIDLEPEIDFNPLGAQHTLTATVTEGLAPLPDIEVTFEVFAGPNAGDDGVDTTDVNGEATFTYTGDGGTGVDEIEAWVVDDVGDTVKSNVALKFWDKDCQDPPNDIPDTCDIDCGGFDGFCSEFAGCGGSADDDGNGVPDECVIPPVVSYGVEGGLPHSATLNGTPVRPVDAVDAYTGELFFSAFPDVILEDIDALHLLTGGSVVFSTSTDVTQGFGGIPNIKNGDLVLWDGVEARLLFSELVGFGGANNNIDAFSILPNGNWLLSTDLNATLGGLAFENGDVVEYDPDEDIASLYMGLDEATIFTGTPQSNADIDALHVTEDGVIFSIRSNGIGRIGVDLSYDWLDVASTDLFLLDPVSGHAELFLDGFRLFDGMTRNLDAVSLAPQARGTISIPEPGRSLLLGFGIVGLLLIGRRRIRA
jgi:hypothetical protein